MGDTSKTPNPIDVHVGSRLKLRRTIMGMSQEKLGEAVGITFQQIQKYEKGLNRIGASRLQQFSETLQMPVSFFFEDLPTSKAKRENSFAEGDSPDFVSDLLSSPDSIQLQKAFVKIKDKKVRKRIIDLVISLADEDEEE